MNVRYAAIVVSSLLMSAIAVYTALQLSAVDGRLAAPPQYDDANYLEEGFDAYEALRNGLPLAVMDFNRHHAPLQSLAAAAGYSIAGVGPWGAYLVNGLGVLILVGVILAITRQVNPVAQLVVVTYVVTLPLFGNLVTEFRPDLFWGLACGGTIYLILHPRFPQHRWTVVVVGAAIALALLAKPSASPAAAALLGATVLMALFLRPFGLAEKAGIELLILIVLTVAVPYFAINARPIAEYIHMALVEQHDLNKLDGPFWAHAAAYPFGLFATVTLAATLWMGLGLAAWNIVTLAIAKRQEDLWRYLAFAAAAFVAYVIPTATPTKTVYLGGIFYGTFLFFTLRSIIVAMAAGRALRRVVPLALCAVALLTFRGYPLMTKIDPRESAEWVAVNNKFIDAIEVAAKKYASLQGVTVMTACWFPVNSTVINLYSRWYGVKMTGDNAYYIDSVAEQKARIGRSDFVILSDRRIDDLPSTKLGPAVLEWVRANENFLLVTDFRFADGASAWLYGRRSVMESVGTPGAAIFPVSQAP